MFTGVQEARIRQPLTTISFGVPGHMGRLGCGNFTFYINPCHVLPAVIFGGTSGASVILVCTVQGQRERKINFIGNIKSLDYEMGN